MFSVKKQNKFKTWTYDIVDEHAYDVLTLEGWEDVHLFIPFWVALLIYKKIK